MLTLTSQQADETSEERTTSNERNGFLYTQSHYAQQVGSAQENINPQRVSQSLAQINNIGRDPANPVSIELNEKMIVHVEQLKHK